MNNSINTYPDTSISCCQDTFILDRPFVLTQDKNLVTGMPYMLLEGNQTKAVRLVKTRVEDHIIYLDVKELKSLKTFSLSWNLNYTGDYWLWSLADLPTIMEMSK